MAQTSKAVREGFREEGDHTCVRFERWGECHVGREVVTDVPFTRTQRKARWRTVCESTGMELGRPDSIRSGKSDSWKVLEQGSHRIKATLSKL